MPAEFESFARVLRRTRREREDSQEHIAELTGARQATVSRWELGKLFPEPDTHRALARYLLMPVADLPALVERSELEAERAKLERKLSKVQSRLSSVRGADRRGPVSACLPAAAVPAAPSPRPPRRVAS